MEKVEEEKLLQFYKISIFSLFKKEKESLK